MADGYKSRTFSVLLYDETESYDCSEVIANAIEYFDEYAYIKHDKDTLDNGTPKKVHWHFVGRFDNARTIVAVSEKLGIPANFIECKKGYTFKKGIRYLAHADDSNKHQYDWHDIESNVDEIGKYFKRDEEEKVLAIYNHIKKNRLTSLSALFEWSMENGCWSEYRRSYGIWLGIINEMKLLDDKEIKKHE